MTFPQADTLWRVVAVVLFLACLWNLSAEWRAFIAGAWLTGEDGLPAFWKMAHIVNTGLLVLVAYWCHADKVLSSCMGWLVSWAVLSVFGSHALKGLQLWAKYKEKAQDPAGPSI